MPSQPVPPVRGLFVTATDTGAGKTTLLCRLIPILAAAGLALCVRKPVESGCAPVASSASTKGEGQLVPRDATALAHAAGGIAVEHVCAYRLRHMSSPARAAQLEGVELTIAALADACTDACAGDDGLLLVEGAGGFYSPIARDGLNADLAIALGLPLLIVVADRLGCINHALLTIEAARRRRLEIAAVVVNETAHRVHKEAQSDTDNYEELKALTDAPVFKIGYAEEGGPATPDIKTLADYLLRLAGG